jgi:hypothetical protein
LGVVALRFGRYGVGAAASTYDVMTWRHLYGTEAALMLVCGAMYCFMSPKMIQVWLLRRARAAAGGALRNS